MPACGKDVAPDTAEALANILLLEDAHDADDETKSDDSAARATAAEQDGVELPPRGAAAAARPAAAVRASGHAVSSFAGAAAEARRVRRLGLALMREAGLDVETVGDLVRSKTFFEVFGFQGLAVLASFVVSAAILVSIVVNGVTVYLYAARLRRGGTDWYDERRVARYRTTFGDFGYDFSMANWTRRDAVVYEGLRDDEGWAARSLISSDFLFSDNYRVEQYRDPGVSSNQGRVDAAPTWIDQ